MDVLGQLQPCLVLLPRTLFYCGDVCSSDGGLGIHKALVIQVPTSLTLELLLMTSVVRHF